MYGCADKHDFGFLRVELEKVDEVPVIDGICALLQIIKLIRDTMAGGDGIKACVICFLVKRHVDNNGKQGNRADRLLESSLDYWIITWFLLILIV